MGAAFAGARLASSDKIENSQEPSEKAHQNEIKTLETNTENLERTCLAAGPYPTKVLPQRPQSATNEYTKERGDMQPPNITKKHSNNEIRDKLRVYCAIHSVNVSGCTVNSPDLSVFFFFDIIN